MNRSTHRPPMAFYHADGLVPAWRLASLYAGKGGRLATLPDITEARLQTKFPAPPWSQYFVTTSAEYYGVGRDGKRKLIVAHGIGPMATLEGMKKAYSWEYKDKNRDRRGGRISQEEFWKLEAGEYGEVSIIDFDTYFSFPRDIRAHESHPFGTKRFSEALGNELLLARLGPKAEEFLQRSYNESREWREKEWHETKDWQLRLEGEDYTDPYIISHEGGHAIYPYVQEWLAYYDEQSPNMAMGHLMVVEQQMNPYSMGGRHIWTTVKLQDWSGGARFLAIPQSATRFKTVHTGPDPRELLDLHWEKLMRPIKEPPIEIDMRILIEFGDEWFTEYPKKGARMDTGEPEFKVVKRKRIGKPVLFRTEAGAGFFYKYDLREISAIAPPGANAYRFTSSTGRDGENWFNRMVQFYCVEVDLSQRLMRESELGEDFAKLLELMDTPV